MATRDSEWYPTLIRQKGVVTDEPVEVEKYPIEVEDFNKKYPSF